MNDADAGDRNEKPRFPPQTSQDGERARRQDRGKRTVHLLGAWYLIVVPILFYSLYKLWPPYPWPGDGNSHSEKAKPETKKSPTEVLTNTGTNTGTPGNAVSNTTDVPSGAKADATSPAEVRGTINKREEERPPRIQIFGLEVQPSLELRLILIVIVAGAIGACIHALTSFADYVGNDSFATTWSWWYVLRPFIGMALALTVYFVYRGGLMTGGAPVAAGSTDSAVNPALFVNPFGVAALAALSGMFTKQATDKLDELFSTMFRTTKGEGDEKRLDKLKKEASDDTSQKGE